MTSLRDMTRRLATTARGADAAAMLGIACFFTFFFGWILFGEAFLVGGDAFAYSYPLRSVGWEMIRGGQLPLWTPLVLSGYPLLSMSQLGFAYPLTWGYLFLDAPRAEQLYVLAPFLLAPAFTYAYARELGRSRTAALLAGLSYAYGGAMTGLLGVVGFFTNAMMWLPLLLIAIERARHQHHHNNPDGGRRFAACLLGASAAYAMSVLTGLAQGFVFVGLVASAYALWFALFDARAATEADTGGTAAPSWTSPARWQPVAVAFGAIALGAGVGAFQILETMRAVRRSIRRTLIYPFFVSGSFSPRVALKSLAAPLYTERFADVGTYVAPLVLLLLALACALYFLRRTATSDATRRQSGDTRILFWTATALVSSVLILGEYTPVYQLLYHVPVINSFRVPSRFAFVWTFAAAILAAYGWDALACLMRGRTTTTKKPRSLSSRSNLVIIFALAAASALTGYFWWRQTVRLAVTDLDAGAGVPRAWLAGFWYAGLPVSAYLVWKLLFTLLTCLLIWRAWKIDVARVRGFVLLAALMLVCFVEPFIVVANWWHPFVKPPARFDAVSPVTRFLQTQSATAAAAAAATMPRSRIYTRVNLFAEEFARSPRFDPPNLTALYALENVGGYEPLLFERYSRALGNVHLDGASPLPGFAPNRALFDARSHVLDLLGARFVVNAAMPATTNAPQIEKEGVRFDAVDLAGELKPGEKIILNATTPVATGDTLALVTFLSNSAHLANGETVALLRLHTSDGRVIERPFRAGIDTAEWAHERADVRSHIRHALAPVFDSATVKDESGSYPSNRYWTKIAFGESLKVERVEIVNATESVPIALWKATLYDSTCEQSQPLKRTQRSLYAELETRRWAAVYDANDVLILENRRALPRAWLVAGAESVDGEEALKRISGESEHAFDPLRTALLEVAPAEMPLLPTSGELAPESNAVRMATYEANRIGFETRAVQPTVLVVSEMFYPGWEATLDGAPAPIHLTNFLLRGVVVPAGEHRVEMRYVASAARNGAVISALSLLVLCVLLAALNLRRSVRRNLPV